MKNSTKILFTLILLFSFLDLNAQWEKIGIRHGRFYGKSNSIGSVVVKAFGKDDNVLYFTTNNYDKKYFLHYSKDDGINWKNIKIPDATLGVENIATTNKQGIYLQYGKTLNNSQVKIDFTPDFGITWKSFNVAPIGFSFDYGNLVRLDTSIYFSVFSGSNIKQLIKIYNPDEWEVDFTFPDGVKTYDLSKNRISYIYEDSLFILNRVDYKLISKQYNPVADAPNNLVKLKCEDSTIVLTRTSNFDFKNDSNFVYVSNNLGSNWQRSTLVTDFLTNINPKIAKNQVFLSFKNNVLQSSNIGLTWKSIVDSTVITDRNFNVVDFKISSDTSLLLQFGNNIYQKKIAEPKWTFLNNVINQYGYIYRINDTLIWSNSPFNGLLSSIDKGITWKPKWSENSKSYLSINNSIYFTRNLSEVFKSKDLGKSWQLSNDVPPFAGYIVKGDTVLLVDKSFAKFHVSGPPYSKWDSISRLYFYDFDFSDGLFYNSDLSSKGIIKSKKDGTIVDTLLKNAAPIRSFLVDKNKIWVVGSDSFRFSNDYGRSWQILNYPNPKLAYFKIVKFKNYLILASATIRQSGKLNDRTGGIYLSANDGKSWFLFSEGIELDDEALSPEMQVIDDYLYLSNTVDNGLWRRKIEELNLNSISGNVFLDSNKNGIKEQNEISLKNVQVSSSNAGSITQTDENGDYRINSLSTNVDTIAVQYDNKYAVVTPKFHLVSQSDTAKNFGLYVPANDLKVNITAITPPRPGFKNTYQINYKNIGSATANGSVSMTYNAKQTFVEATTAPTSNTNQTLVWNYTNLQPNETRVINLTLKTATDAPIRTAITHVATIDPLSIDTFKTDNVDSLVLTVVGSYDPNDKQVTFNNSKSAPAVIDNTTELTYTIRFQNTGNYPADFVKVSDTLSDKLDISTLRIIATSHKYDVSLKNKNVLTFDFNPIFLPDSTSNEKDSHGFIKFAIKPKKTLTKEEVIKNTGYIFFDYNPPIITNTVETANQKANSLFTPSVSEPLVIYPNPTTGFLTFKMDKNIGKEIAVSIYSIDGKLMISKHQTAQSENIINGETLHEGLYFLQIKVGEEVKIGKFLVKK
jgi:uncharacterized repeat protein (TIGR01451 family)